MPLPSPSREQSWLPSPTIKTWYFQFRSGYVHSTDMKTITWSEIMRYMRTDWNNYNPVTIDWLELGYAV